MSYFELRLFSDEKKELLAILEQSEPLTIEEIQALIKEKDSALVEHTLEVTLVKNSSYAFLTLVHYKKVLGGINVYKFDPFIVELVQNNKIKIPGFPLIRGTPE